MKGLLVFLVTVGEGIFKDQELTPPLKSYVTGAWLQVCNFLPGNPDEVKERVFIEDKASAAIEETRCCPPPLLGYRKGLGYTYLARD